MFTGIIQNRSIVTRKEKRKGQIRFYFCLQRKVSKPLKLGESIAVNGVCLTAARVDGKTFGADVIRETLEATTLSHLKEGDRVNLERSLKLGDEIGGHFVTGHVDQVGMIRKISTRGKNRSFEIDCPKLTRRLAVKGSVAVDGVSLTIQKLNSRGFCVGLVPHTLKETTLGKRRVGEQVNLEMDLIARYLETLNPAVQSASSAHPKKPTFPRLKRQGF